MSKPTTGDFTKTAGWLDWYTGPAKPKFQLPAGAVDAHCHVFGPGRRVPLPPSASTTLDASKHELYPARPPGFARVIVQATCHARTPAPWSMLLSSGGKARGVHRQAQVPMRAASPARRRCARVRFNFASVCRFHAKDE